MRVQRKDRFNELFQQYIYIYIKEDYKWIRNAFMKNS